MAAVRMGKTKFASVTVIEPLPTLMVSAGRADEPAIVVDGMSADTAVALDWGAIIDFAIKVGKEIFGDKGSSGGGGTGCTKSTIENADGSKTTIEQCPPPKQA